MNNSEQKLEIVVGSFSFKKGLPIDKTEHGGGFVFDCRCVQNPGREERFKTQTGRDPEVRAFLQQHPEADQFWNHVEGLVMQAVNKYKSRGFSYLSIQFGCTGGQHRSVFFAEKTAAMLQGLDDVSVSLTHRDMPR